jgi:hypothetical protein
MSHDDVRKPSAEYVESHGEAFEAHQAALASQYQPGTEEERKLVWKIDKRIVVSDPNQSSGGDKPTPTLWRTYLALPSFELQLTQS